MTVNIRKQISSTTDNNVQISPDSNLISPSEQIFDDSNPNLDENSKNHLWTRKYYGTKWETVCIMLE